MVPALAGAVFAGCRVLFINHGVMLALGTIDICSVVLNSRYAVKYLAILLDETMFSSYLENLISPERLRNVEVVGVHKAKETYSLTDQFMSP